MTRSIEEVLAEHRRVEAAPLAPSFGALLDRAAADHAGREAFVFFERGEALTYGALRDQANRLANALAAIGVGKGTKVALMMPNVPEYPVSWFALAKLGGVAVPVNCRYTARELGYVLGDSGAEFLIVHRDHGELLGSLERGPGALAADHIVSVRGAIPGAGRQWDELVEGAAPDFRGPAVGPDDLLNIQYTSGTTGLPKGCMQTHRYWVSAGHVMRHIDGADISRILAPTYFFYLDTQLMTAFALHTGATVYVANQLSASRFMDWVRAYGIEFVFMFEPVFKQPPRADDGDNELKLCYILGLSKDNHAALETRFATIARERFGMTEASLLLYMPNDHAHMVGSGSCGIPAPFREVAILDPAGRPVPAGEAGELWVRGASLMQGYYNRPEANAEAFRDGWLRTGDLFRQDADGYYYVVGRIKDMIRRSEENIAAQEVEAVLRAMPEMIEAACVPVPDELRGEEVKAYIRLEGGLTPEDVPPDAVFAHCQGLLAHFKIPRYLEYRDGFPYGPSHKVEKQKLIAEKADLRAGCYDRVDGRWR